MQQVETSHILCVVGRAILSPAGVPAAILHGPPAAFSMCEHDIVAYTYTRVHLVQRRPQHIEYPGRAKPNRRRDTETAIDIDRYIYISVDCIVYVLEG